MRDGESFAVTRILDVSDADALAAGASSYRPYEPLFGYDLGAFHPQFVPGDVRQIDDGAFNMTNPVSLVFPRENGLMPFQRIGAADADALDEFVTRTGSPWQPPVMQSMLTWTSLAGLAVTLALAGSRRRPKTNGRRAA
jgi:hypothetical protein